MAISKVTGGGILDNSVTDADINSSKLNGVASSANNYTHPNHSGDVVSSADGATVIQTDAVDIAMLSATGSPGSTTFLRGDNSWAAAGSTSASDLTSGTIPAARIGDDVITADKLANSINSAIAANTSKTGITSSQANAITANTAKTGITSSQATAITAALPKAGGTLTGATNLTVNQTANTQFSIVNNSGGTTAAASLKLQTGGGASGDPFIHINNEVQHISIGIDNSDGDKFKISDATTLGSNDRFVINTAGVVSIPQGIELGSGIDATAANTLDDYEEGTWTPAVASNTTSCSMGQIYTSHYTKIGNVVKLYTSFDIDSSANPGTGNLRFTGFPFALKTLGEGSFLISLYYNYKVAPMVFMSKGGYTYYTNTTVNGNNLRNLTETIGQNTTNVMGMQFSYLTDA